MPRWNNNPVDASLGFPIYDPGMYRIKVKEVKPFVLKLKENQNPGEESGGVRALCHFVGGPNHGKPFQIQFWWHNEGGRSFGKSILVPLYGFNADLEGEKAFDAIAAEKDWNIDPENNTLGDGWTHLVDREVNAELGIEPQRNDPNKMQQTAKYMPV